MNEETNEVYKENYELKKKVKEMEKDFSSIESMIVCIGGPLNDNILKYNKNQLVIFTRILTIAKYNI